ncbi:MAG: hypothetical protein JKX94_01110, partial [Sneathiella sp.]|nr:hypothetical protein [Sneathiella sp.]
RKIGHLLHAPEAPLVSRFGPILIRRLHQAIGQEPEIFGPLFPPPVYQVRHPFEEPVIHVSALEAALEVLAKKMEDVLKNDQKGARNLEVQIFRVDGHIERLSIGTSRLCQQADHISLLFFETLSRLHEDLDTGFGIDLMTMAAYDVERMADEQSTFSHVEEPPNVTAPQPASSQDMDQLLDRFGNRFGFDRITRFSPVESYIPEKAFQAVPVNITEKRPPWLEAQEKKPLRPFLLFHPPELITVLAEVPDGPPLRFEWRRLHHHITRAEGPERLAPEWWNVKENHTSKQTRDYYRVEDKSGHRFWLYRDGLYDRKNDIPRWYIQGLFP